MLFLLSTQHRRPVSHTIFCDINPFPKYQLNVNFFTQQYRTKGNNYRKAKGIPKHTVWEASLGAKKVSQVGTITVIKIMQNLNEICKN